MHTLTHTARFTLLALGCLTIMVGCVIVPGLPAVASHLGVAPAASWLVTIPSLGVVIFGPAAGKLIERAGLYSALCIGLFAYGLLGLGGVACTGPVAVFADRLLLGGATAVVMSAGTGLISVFFDGDARLAMIARQGMAIELGGVLFFSLGGVLASAAWFWPFTLYLVAWLLLALVVIVIPRPRAPSNRLHDGAARPTLSPALKRTYGAALCSMIVFFTAIIMLPARLHSIGLTETQTGYFLSFVSLVAVCAAAVMPKAIRRFNMRGTLCLAFFCYAVAHGLFAFITAMPLLLLAAIFLGCGFGLSIPSVNHATVELSPEPQRGRFLAYLSMAIFSGQFLSSFMAFIPGPATRVFAAAALLAAIVVVLTAATVVKRLSPVKA